MNKKTMKNLMKVLYILIIMMMIISMITPVFAYDNPSGVTADSSAKGTFDNQMNKIMGLVQGIGIGVMVIILVVLGIKYMVGSSEERAEYKKTFIPYIVGAVLVGGASVIANAIYTFGTGMTR
jgi:type IV secretory pathway VirB2 component (pilin)